MLGLEIDASFEARSAALPVSRLSRRLALITMRSDDHSAPETLRPRLSFGGSAPREVLRLGLQQIVEEATAPENVWLVRWLLGRWPRGNVRTVLPVSVHGEEVTVGLIAPLMPTRIALSESPLPFDRETVAHFKALHERLAQPGLLGCRLALADRRVAGLAGRWRLSADALEPALIFSGFDGNGVHLARAVLQGLGGTQPVFERWFHPAPAAEVHLELYRVRTNRAVALVEHLWGAERTQVFTEAVRSLGGDRLQMVSVQLGNEGLTEIAVAAGLSGDHRKGPW